MRKISIFIILTIILVTMLGYLFFKPESNPPANSIQSTQNSVQQTTNTTKLKSGGDLESCLYTASNSEANQAIIDQARKDCYDIYR